MIKIIIPTYNSEQWISKCVQTVLDQTYIDWEMIIINDGSTDNTKNILYSFSDKRITCIHNKNNGGSPLKSFCQGITLTNEEDIIVTLDGDDWLYSNDVLEYLNFIYTDPNILVTYGQFVPSDNSYANHCVQIKSTINHRKHMNDWRYSHLRTFRKILWKYINQEDLKENGDYFETAGDVALFLPILELAGVDRIKFIDKILYVYNNENILNEMKIKVNKQLCTFNKLKDMPEYKRVIL